MWWSWTNSAIQYKIGGEFRSVSGQTMSYSFHMGGKNCQFTKTISFAQPIEFKTGIAKTLNLKFDAKEIWENPLIYNFDTDPTQSGHGPNDPLAKKLTNNVADGVFSLQSIN
jgi:hypothetical protein